MSINFGAFIASLKYMVEGWLGIFIVMGIIIAAIYGLNRVAEIIDAKLAAKKEADHAKELEDAKNAAYESGKADAIAAEVVVGTVTAAAEESAPAAEEKVEEPAPTPEDIKLLTEIRDLLKK